MLLFTHGSFVGWDQWRDVIALQEVDRPRDLATDLARAGYATAYEQRNGGRQDGCMLAWKRDRLALVAPHAHRRAAAR